MLLKIKLPKIFSSLSFRLTAWHSLVLFCTLILCSAIVVFSLYLFLNRQARHDLTVSRQATIDYLQNNPSIDKQLLEENLLVPGVDLLIYNHDGQVILDSSPYMTGQRFDRRGKKIAQEFNNGHSPLRPREFFDYRDNQTYIKQEVAWNKDGQYLLQFRRDITGNIIFLKMVATSLAIACILAMIVAISISRRISRRALQPLHDLISDVQKIDASNLSNHIVNRHAVSELSVLSEKFNDMLARLQHGLQRERDFSLAAAHELRTPLTIINGNIDLILRWGSQDPSLLDNSLAVIKQETDSMNAMLSHLLLLANSDNNDFPLTLQEVCIADLINIVCDEFRLISPQHVFISQLSPTIFLHADYDRLHQLLRILMDNACKFSPPNSTITITLTSVNQKILFSIHDNGPGIPLAEQSKIFDRFYRVDKSRSTPGHGLGLSLAKTIANAHNAQIALDNTVEHGSKFVVVFPERPQSNC